MVSGLRLIFLLSSAQAILLGNYKLYDSRGSALYDFSGNRNNAEVSWVNGSSPVLTDRGQYFYASSQIDFPTNMYKLYPSTSTTMVVAMWLLPATPGRLFRLSKIENSQVINCYIDWLEHISGKTRVILTSPAGAYDYFTLINYCKINADEWNFIILHFTQGSSSTTLKIYDDSERSEELFHTFNGFLFASADTMWGIKMSDVGGFQGFFYEIWWRDDILTSIRNTFSAIEQAKPSVFTKTPQQDPFKTYNNLSCSSSCTNNRNSCSGSASSCLTSCNIGCTNGCYDFRTPTCISPTTIYCTTINTSTNTCTRCRNNFTLTNSSCACSSTQAMISVITISKCVERVANCSKYSYFTEQCYECNTGFFIACIGTPCTNSCLSDCPLGYYKSSTIPVTCIVCRPECLSCTDANTCTACVSGKYLKLASCVDSCGVGYFQNNTTRTCIQCPASCNACNYSGNTLVCTACSSGYYIKAGVCVLSCGVGYFQNSTAWTCIQCSANCNTCTYSADVLVCTVCASGYYMQAGSCVATCSTGFYLNTVSSSCIQCPSSCSACTSNTVCTSCKSGYTLTTVGLISSCENCPVGEYGSNNVCYTCPGICTACTSISQCTSCIQNASVSAVNGFCECNLGFSYSSGSCIQAFTASATMDLDGKINLIFSKELIAELNSNLLSFKSDSLTFDSSTFSINSITPKIMYAITLNKVLLRDPSTLRLYFPTGLDILRSIDSDSLVTEYSDILITASSITTSCSSISNCATCIISSADFVCDSCRDLNCLYSDPSIRCGICCDDGYYKETVSSINICTKCDTKCHTCSDSSTCLSCNGSFYLLNNNCVTNCGVGKYKNLSNNQCLDCIENCDMCSDRSSCTTCRSEYIYNSFINICEPCPEGTYYNNQACETCPNLCRSCSSASCSECVENAYNLGGTCHCDTKYSLIDNECVRSSELHATAEMNAAGIILLSFDTELLEGLSYNSIAFTIENIGYNSTYFTISEIDTHKVYSISLNISLLGVSNLILSFEEPSSIISVESAKVEETNFNILVPFETRCDSSNICEFCPEICTECPGNQCMKCTNSYYLFNATCVSECPAGYYHDSLASKCEMCGVEGCISCEFNLDTNSTICFECSENSILIEIENIMSCMKYSNSTELSNQICPECSSQCNQYKGQIECDICIENSLILASECIIISITQEIKFLSASLQYIKDNMLMLSFEKPLLNDLTAESILIYVNNSTYSLDKVEISRYQSSNQHYTIILEDLNLNIDNNITINFSNDTFSMNQSSYLSQVSVSISAQPKYDLSEDSSITNSTYTEEDLSQAKQVEYISNTLSTVSTVVSAVSIASGNANAWIFISTIQIFSFIKLLQVDMPIILNSYLQSQVSYYPAYDIFKDVMDDSIKPYKKARDFKYQSSNFILNTGKPLFVLSLIILINTMSRISTRFSKGRLKNMLDKVNVLFNYGVYLRFSIQMHIELLVPALLQLLYVRYIQPDDDSMFKILTYILAMIFSVRFTQIICSILPIFIMKFIHFNYSFLFSDEMEPIWGVLYSELRNNQLATQFYSIFFIRRLILAISFNLLIEYPLPQLILCSISCLMIFIYIALVCPFKARALNILNILSEMNVTIGYTLNIMFLVDTGIDDKIVGWCILASIAFTYAIHIILMIFNIIQIIIKKLRERCNGNQVRDKIPPSAIALFTENRNHYSIKLRNNI